jgi:hypothetical protein
MLTTLLQIILVLAVLAGFVYWRAHKSKQKNSNNQPTPGEHPTEVSDSEETAPIDNFGQFHKK